LSEEVLILLEVFVTVTAGWNSYKPILGHTFEKLFCRYMFSSVSGVSTEYARFTCLHWCSISNDIKSFFLRHPFYNRRLHLLLYRKSDILSHLSHLASEWDTTGRTAIAIEWGQTELLSTTVQPKVTDVC